LLAGMVQAPARLNPPQGGHAGAGLRAGQARARPHGPTGADHRKPAASR
jgi:hypothetical protein